MEILPFPYVKEAKSFKDQSRHYRSNKLIFLMSFKGIPFRSDNRLKKKVNQKEAFKKLRLLLSTLHGMVGRE